MNELDGTHAAYSKTHYLFPPAAGTGERVGATVADTPLFPALASQALGFHKPPPVLNSLKGCGWNGHEALPACCQETQEAELAFIEYSLYARHRAKHFIASAQEVVTICISIL